VFGAVVCGSMPGQEAIETLSSPYERGFEALFGCQIGVESCSFSRQPGAGVIRLRDRSLSGRREGGPGRRSPRSTAPSKGMGCRPLGPVLVAWATDASGGATGPSWPFRILLALAFSIAPAGFQLAAHVGVGWIVGWPPFQALLPADCCSLGFACQLRLVLGLVEARTSPASRPTV